MYFSNIDLHGWLTKVTWCFHVLWECCPYLTTVGIATALVKPQKCIVTIHFNRFAFHHHHIILKEAKYGYKCLVQDNMNMEETTWWNKREIDKITLTYGLHESFYQRTGSIQRNLCHIRQPFPEAECNASINAKSTEIHWLRWMENKTLK